jgi:hypothetical protein
VSLANNSLANFNNQRGSGGNNAVNTGGLHHSKSSSSNSSRDLLAPSPLPASAGQYLMSPGPLFADTPQNKNKQGNSNNGGDKLGKNQNNSLPTASPGNLPKTMREIYQLANKNKRKTSKSQGGVGNANEETGDDDVHARSSINSKKQDVDSIDSHSNESNFVKSKKQKKDKTSAAVDVAVASVSTENDDEFMSKIGWGSDSTAPASASSLLNQTKNVTKTNTTNSSSSSAGNGNGKGKGNGNGNGNSNSNGGMIESSQYSIANNPFSTAMIKTKSKTNGQHNNSDNTRSSGCKSNDGNAMDPSESFFNPYHLQVSDPNNNKNKQQSKKDSKSTDGDDDRMPNAHNMGAARIGSGAVANLKSYTYAPSSSSSSSSSSHGYGHGHGHAYGGQGKGNNHNNNNHNHNRPSTSFKNGGNFHGKR